MNKHLNEYTALLKKKKAFCVEQLKTLDKFLLLCRRMQIRCEGLLQADAFRQLSTGEADDAVRLPEEEEFSLGLLQISATLLKDRITGTEASLRAVQVGANHFCEKIDTAYGHDWAAWTDAVWNAAHRAEVIMVTSIFSRGVSATMREKESLYRYLMTESTYKDAQTIRVKLEKAYPKHPAFGGFCEGPKTEIQKTLSADGVN